MTCKIDQSELATYRELLEEARSRLLESQEQIESIQPLLENFQHKIKRIDDALQRIVNEVYGICLMCAKPIQPDRLRNLPYAEYCLTCQQAHERGGQSK